MSQGIRKSRNKSLRANACKLAWSAAVYNIWWQRNDLMRINLEQRRKCFRLKRVTFVDIKLILIHLKKIKRFKMLYGK
jgi:hypothetical protein